MELKGIKLPESVEKKIEGEIREVVMRNVAGTDLLGDQAWTIRWPPGLRGIVIEQD